MYAKKISGLIAATLFCSALVFTSCKKESTSKDSDIESAQDNALAESSFNDVTTITDQAALSGSVNIRMTGDAAAAREEGSLGSGCATVTQDTVNTPHSLTVDFGTTNCLCNDGRYRRGKIIGTYSGRYREAGTVIAVSFNNYFVNDNQLTGTKTITNKGLNGSGNLVYKIEVNGSVVKANNGGTATWVSSREREWIAGANTAILSDDVYAITGTASGKTAAGKSYTITITKALVRKMNCRWFESGTLDVTPDGKPTRTLDYGNIGCDANATVTILGFTFPIVLK